MKIRPGHEHFCTPVSREPNPQHPGIAALARWITYAQAEQFRRAILVAEHKARTALSVARGQRDASGITRYQADADALGQLGAELHVAILAAWGIGERGVRE